MKTSVDKSKADHASAAAAGQARYRAVDNRREAAVQRSAQAIADNSPHQQALQRRLASAPPIQRKITDNLSKGTRITIDAADAPDFGEFGTAIRPSRARDRCMAVSFDTEPAPLYRVGFDEMSVVAADIPGALAATARGQARGNSDMFQTLDPATLAADIYGRSDQEKRQFLLLACEDAVLTQAIQEAGSIGEAEQLFATLENTDRRKAVEEALTIKWLGLQNRHVTNIRRPPPEVKGKYDYLIDLPDHHNVPVDPKVILPYVEKHWNPKSETKAQKAQSIKDVLANKDPQLPFKVAQGIALARQVDKPDNYARWMESCMRSQLHELTEVHASGESRFKGIVISNVAYIQQVHQADLNTFITNPDVLAYFGLTLADVGRIIQVAPPSKSGMDQNL